MQNQSTTHDALQLSTRRSSLSKSLQIACAILLGCFILYGVGFVNAATVHNAAHDIRHAQAFPCH